MSQLLLETAHLGEPRPAAPVRGVVRVEERLPRPAHRHAHQLPVLQQVHVVPLAPRPQLQVPLSVLPPRQLGQAPSTNQR